MTAHVVAISASLVLGWTHIRPDEHPRVGVIRVLGGVPVVTVDEQRLPEEPILVEFVPPPTDRLPEPPDEPIDPTPFDEPTAEVRPAPDVRDDPRLLPFPDRAFTELMRPEPVAEPAVEVEPSEPPPPAPPTVAGQSVDPMPIDELNEPPPYPPRAIRLRQEGRVVLRVVVDERGHVLQCTMLRSSGFDMLDHAALEAVRAWVFRDGPGEVDLPVDFVLRSRRR